MVDLSLWAGSLSVLVKNLFWRNGILKYSKVAELLQNSKWLATELFLGWICLLLSGDIPLCGPVIVCTK